MHQNAEPGGFRRGGRRAPDDKTEFREAVQSSRLQQSCGLVSIVHVEGDQVALVRELIFPLRGRGLERGGYDVRYPLGPRLIHGGVLIFLREGVELRARQAQPDRLFQHLGTERSEVGLRKGGDVPEV